MGPIQIYLNKTATTKRCAFVMFPLLVLLLNFPDLFTGNIIYSGHKLLCFLFLAYEDILNDIRSADQSGNCESRPVRTALEVVTLTYFVPQTNISKRRKERQRVIHCAMDSMFHGLLKSQHEGLMAFTSDRGMLNMFAFVAFYSCENLEVK